MPRCQMRRRLNECNREATYDAAINGIGSWAYMCDEHYSQFGSNVHFTKLKDKNNSIKEAVAAYHKERGCCDGSDLTKCTFKEKKLKPVKEFAEPEYKPKPFNFGKIS